MAKIDKHSESFTAILPRKYRAIAKKNWDELNLTDKFNYGLVVRHALHDYYVTRGWIE